MADPFLRPLLAPWTFRFRGRTARILAIVDAFLAEPNRGLAPTLIARQSGLPLYDVARLLSRTPELFVKLPGRGDGITRYRLASSVAAQSEAEIAALVHRHARRENLVYYLLLGMGALMLLIVLLALAPAVL